MKKKYLAAAALLAALALTPTMNSFAASGWTSENGNWGYYDNDGNRHKGWIQTKDGYYYMDTASGVMLKGFKKIDGKWYYFTPETTAYTYEYDAVNEKWFYKAGNTVRPHGSMYVNETTPDGYRVDANGAWQR